MKATNILWDVDESKKPAHWEAHYVCSRCGESVRTIKKECPFCHARMNGEVDMLPTEIEIPAGMTDPDEISDFLSDVTGFCHKGFELEYQEEQQ